jgi:hypothetical protein
MHLEYNGVGYGHLLAESGAPIEPATLIVPMLERFIATDRGFAKARRPSVSV